MKAYILALSTALVWGVVPIIEKIGLTKVTPMTGIFIRSCGVIIGIAILAVFNSSAAGMVLKTEPKIIFLLMLSGLMASVVGQVFLYNALKIGEASKLVPVAGTYPLVAFILGVIFLGEGITAAKAGGAVLIIAGLFLLR